MPEFSYQASGRDGQTVGGQLSADSVSGAIAELESRGLTILSIRLETQGVTSARRSDWQPDVASPHAVLDRQFEKAMANREALLPAWTALTSEMPAGRDRSEIRKLTLLLRQAETVSDLRRSPLATQWLPLLATTFSDESQAARLTNLIDRASRQHQNRRQWHRAIAYPLAVFLVAALVFTLLCLLIVPTFGGRTGTFQEFGMQLPASTKLLVSISDEMRFHPVRTSLRLLFAAIAVFAVIQIWIRCALTNRLLGRFAAGNSASVNAISNLTSQLAELLDVGVGLPDALWLAGQSCRHADYRSVAQRLAHDAHHASVPLAKSTVAARLPANVVHALTAGPDGGPHIALLRGLSEIYGERAGRRASWSGGAYGQLAIVVIGLLVGFVMLALFAPLTSLISGLT